MLFAGQWCSLLHWYVAGSAMRERVCVVEGHQLDEGRGRP